MSSKTIKRCCGPSLVPDPSGPVLSYRDALKRSMHNALAKHPGVVIMGQGVDDHKGTFGSTLGMAQEFGAHRVMDTPLAEEAMAGVAVGAALNGLYPIQTHLRSDFALIAMNQLVNLAAKYRYMSGGKFVVPMLVRMAIGRSWGQGAQHSQSIQSMFAHVPGLSVIMPSSSSSVLECYEYAVRRYKGPVISLEHRLLYDVNFQMGKPDPKRAANPFTSYCVRSGKDITVVASSVMVLEALRAADHVARAKGIQCEVIDLNCVSDPDKSMILRSVGKTGRLLIADTSWLPYGVCAEVCRFVCENSPSSLKAPVVSLGMQFAPCPTAKVLEDMYYPNLRDMVDAIGRLVTGKKKHGVYLPDPRSTRDFFKSFKGPF
ncbi:alpha-ketoacid dehydrogenase subunit beta [Elusimicrobiota bacterium]